MTIFIGGDNSDFLKKWESTKRALRKGLGSDAIDFSETLATGFAALTAAMGTLGLASIKMAGEMQANKKAFATLLGDSQQAEKFLGDLAKFASATPFELPGLVTASKRLLAFSFSAQDIIPMMAAIGDTASMLGVGEEGINRMTLAIGQMQAKGKVSAEEMLQLAESGVPAWQFLADAIGTDIPTAMKMAESGAIDSTTGINAVLMGMQTKFKGGMAGLSQEIPGLFSTIKDNVASVMKEIGNGLITSLDIKSRMQQIVTYLDQFASYVKSSGINAALRDLIPKELSLAIFMVAGALTVAAIPALVSFAIAAWTAIAPLAPFIAGGAALGAVAWVIWQAWEPLGSLFVNTWTAAVNYTVQKWAELKSVVYSGVQNVLSAVMPLLNLFGGGIQSAAAGWLESVSQGATSASEEAAAAAERAQAAANGISTAWDGIGDKITAGAQELKESVSGLNTTFTGLTGKGTQVNPSVQANGSAGAGASAWDKLKDKAEQVSKEIRSQWIQTTKTEIEQLDIWKAEQLAALEETKAANANYQQDVTRLEAVYSVRRRKIMEDEAKKRNSIWDQAADSARSLVNKLGGIGKSGVTKEKFDIESDATAQIESVQRKYRDLAAEYASSTKAEQEEFKKAWQANGIQFEVVGEGMVTFSRQVAAEQVAIEAEKNQKLKDLHYERVKFQEDLEEARKEGDIERYRQLLTEQQALAAQDLAGRQEYIDTYYEMWRNSHRSSMSYMAEAMSGLYGGLQGFFSDIISGTKSIGDAWQDLGRKIIKIIADMAAQWVASRLVMSVFDKFSIGTKTSTPVSAPGVNAKNLASSLTGRASGGPVSAGTLYKVNELGMETFVPAVDGYILNAKQTRQIQGSSGSGPTIVMNISTPDAQSFRQSQGQILASMNMALAQGRRNL